MAEKPSTEEGEGSADLRDEWLTAELREVRDRIDALLEHVAAVRAERLRRTVVPRSPRRARGDPPGPA
jgi:hypothetical protein